MSARVPRLVTVVSLAAVALVLVAVIAQAIRRGSLDPVWEAGWLPAVAVGIWYRPGPRRRCWPRWPARDGGGR